MALNYAQRADAAADGNFVKRVMVGAVKLANYTAASEPENTPNHANRVAFASAVLANPGAYAPQLALGVLTQGVADEIESADDLTDTNIQSALESMWNAYAGVATGGA